MNETTKISAEESQAPPAVARPWVTNALIIANIAAFTWMVLATGWRTILMPDSDTLLAWGANYGRLTLNGEWWRVFTSGFLHIGIFHAFMNMWVLYDVGRAVEELYGSVKFFAIYMLAMVGGCICSLFVNPMTFGAGASGAVFGAFGALLAFWWMHRRMFPAGFIRHRAQVVVFLLACTLLYGFFTPEIDNAAHIGGLIFGYVSGLLLMPRKAGSLAWTLKDSIAVLGLTASFIMVGWVEHAYLFPRNNNVIAYNLAHSGVQLLREQKFEEALKKFDELVKRMPQLASAYGYRAEALTGLRRYDEALRDAKRCIMLEPHEGNGYLLRGGIYHQMGENEKALADLDLAVRYAPRKPDTFNNRAWTLVVLKRYKAAVDDANRAIKLDPSMSAAYVTRGLAHYYGGDSEKARNNFDMAISLNPKDGAAYYHRSLITGDAGDLEKSRKLKYEPEKWEVQRNQTH